MTVGAGMDSSGMDSGGRDSSGRDSSTAPSSGLRARKRAAASAAIEKSAIALALERGYEHVTVEMICAASMVSQRTFFNYFGSKEGVFLGPAATSEAVDRAFRADGGTSIVLSLARAVVSALLEGSSDPALARGRMKVIMDAPELLAKQDEWMAVQESHLVDLVLERYAAEHRGDPAPELAAEARMVVGLALAVVRVVLQQNHVEDDGACPTAAAMERAAVLLQRIFGPPSPESR